MKKTIILLIVSLLSASLFGCSNSSPTGTTTTAITETTTEISAETTTEASVEWKTDIYKGLALQYPSTWTKRNKNESRYYYVEDKIFLFLQSISIPHDLTKLTESKQEEAMELVCEDIEKGGSTVLNKELKKYGDRPGFELNYAQRIDDISFKANKRALFANQMVYLLTAVCPADSGKEYENDFNRIMNSITIDDSYTVASSSEESTTKETQPASDSGEVDKIDLTLQDGTYLKYKDHKIVEDHKGNSCIRLYFTFHNEKDMAQILELAFIIEVYQNSVQCERGFSLDSDEATNNAFEKVQKGGEIDCALDYKLNDMENDVQLKVRGLIDIMNDSAGQTMTIKLK